MTAQEMFESMGFKKEKFDYLQLTMKNLNNIVITQPQDQDPMKILADRLGI